jgi:flavin-dependent dehydrogenase
MAVCASGDPAAAVIDAAPGLRVDEIMCDVLVVGGGTGGIACALAATRTLPASGRVALLEETDWVAGEVRGAPDSLEYAAVGRLLT